MTRPDATTLWLPLRDPVRAWVTFSALLLAYVLTMGSDAWFYDSAEFALVACQPGLGHPTGQPLHTLLGFLFCHSPWVSPATGVTLLSAVSAALLAFPALCLVETWCPERRALPSPQRRTITRWIPSLVLLGYGLHFVLWDGATRIELYTTAVFFALWGTAKALAGLAHAHEHMKTRGWCGVGLAFGLGACVNPYLSLFSAIGVAPSLVAAIPRKHLSWRGLLALVGGGLGALLLYAYPLIVARWPRDAFVWGLPTDWSSITFYFSGADYAHNREATAALTLHNLGTWATWALGANVLLPLLVGIAGSVASGQRARVGGPLGPIVTCLALLLVCANNRFHPEILDYIDYLAGAFAIAAAGTAALLLRAAERANRTHVIASLAALLAATMPCWSYAPLQTRTRDRDRTSRVIAESLLREAPANAIVVGLSDHWVAPALYLQAIEGQRPDVVVLPVGLASSSWYWDYLYRRHSDLQNVVLRAPGGANARIRRFLTGNPGRPVLVQTWALASQLDLNVCGVGWFLRTSATCDTTPLAAIDANAALAQLLASAGRGSPPAEEVIASIALDRAEALWRLGQGGPALRAMLAGVPLDMMPRGLSREIGETAVLQGPLPAWQRSRPIADPARNLFLAGQVLLAAGRNEDGFACVAAAATDGLPEAEQMLRRAQ